jgi:hypothetical protein
MKHLLFRRPAAAGPIAFGICALMLVAPAFAQLKKPPPIEGQWKFETGKFRDGNCTISGSIVFVKQTNSQAYSCSFASHLACGAAPVSIFDVKQACTATYSNGEFAIVSEVKEIVRRYQGAYPLGTVYRPDDFYVRPQPNGDLTGKFSSVSTSTVRFWREGDLVS